VFVLPERLVELDRTYPNATRIKGKTQKNQKPTLLLTIVGGVSATGASSDAGEVNAAWPSNNATGCSKQESANPDL
jgi:hypothetical protein